MGGIISTVLNKTLLNKSANVVFIGCESSGKSTIVYKFKLDENVTTIPTIGFNTETISFKNLSLNIIDLGGALRIRPLWRHHYDTCDIIVFVIDSSNPQKIEESKIELQKIISDEILKKKVLLILANKQDVDGALKAEEIEKKLDLGEGKWKLFGCSAMTGEGLFDAFDWLITQSW